MRITAAVVTMMNGDHRLRDRPDPGPAHRETPEWNQIYLDWIGLGISTIVKYVWKLWDYFIK